MARQWCSYCGSHDHMVSLCPKTWGGQANRNALHCAYCGGQDHTNTSCPKRGLAQKVAGTFVLDRR